MKKNKFFLILALTVFNVFANRDCPKLPRLTDDERSAFLGELRFCMRTVNVNRGNIRILFSMKRTLESNIQIIPHGENKLRSEFFAGIEAIKRYITSIDEYQAK